MKILMENKKKQIVYITIMALSLGVTIWIWSGSSSSGGGSSNVSTMMPAANVPGMTVVDAKTGMLGGNQANGTSKGLLPYGTEFKTEIFSKDSFKELVAGKILEVKSEELGKDNPFE